MPAIDSVSSPLYTKTNITHTIERTLLEETNPLIQRKAITSGSTFMNGVAKAFLWFLPLGTIAGLSPELLAQNNPANEKAVVDHVKESWGKIKTHLDQEKPLSELPDRNILWNNIQATLHVTVNTMVSGMDEIRKQLIIEGAKNPDILPRVVHGALYTQAVLAQNLNKNFIVNTAEIQKLTQETKEIQKKEEELIKLGGKLKEEVQDRKIAIEKRISELTKENKSLTSRIVTFSLDVSPYLGKVIVDTQKGTVKERHLVRPSELDFFKKSYTSVEVYDSGNFKDLASFVLGQIGDKTFLDSAGSELARTGINEDRSRDLLNIFLYSDKKIPDALIERSRIWVFGNDQIQKYFDGLKEKVDEKNKETTAPEKLKMPLAKEAPIPNPGAPETGVGSLEVIEKINSKLISPLIIYPFKKSEKEQESVADIILMWANTGSNTELITPAASQWFATKHLSEGINSKFSKADSTVLQALAKVSVKDKTSFEILKRVIASFPKQSFDTFYKASLYVSDSPQRRAGVEITNALTANRKESIKLLIDIADGKAEILWPIPKIDNRGPIRTIEELNKANKTIDEIKIFAREEALKTMTLIDEGKNFIPYLREVLNNPFTQETDKRIAASGLGLARDKESLETLLRMGVDQTLSISLRSRALNSALYIDSENLVPESIQQLADNESPFAPNKLRYIFPDLRKKESSSGKEIDLSKALIDEDPFQRRIVGNYNAWLKEQQTIVDLSVKRGKEPVTIQNVDRARAMLESTKREFTTSIGLISKMGNGKTSSTRYLDEMLRYLESCKDNNKSLNFRLASPMIEILGRASYKKAAPVLTNIVIYPEKYFNSEDVKSGWDLFDRSLDTTLLKAQTIANLGQIVDLENPNDLAGKTLHTISRKDTSSFFRNVSYLGLMYLGKRYDEALNSELKAGQRLNLLTTRKFHANEALGHLKHYQNERLYDSRAQVRLRRISDEFYNAKVADKLGGREELLKMALEEKKKDESASIVRSVMHALRSNQCMPNDLDKLSFEPKTIGTLKEMYNYIINEEYWQGPPSKYTGKGQTVAIVDVGYIFPSKFYPTLKEKTKYPDYFKARDISDYLDLHPTAVASNFHRNASNANIWSYSAVATVPEIPFRPPDTQDAVIIAYENIAELLISGKVRFDLVSQSWGPYNDALNSAKARDEIDQYGAFMEVLSKMGVVHTVAAGNEHGYFPAFGRFGPIGETLSLGSRFNTKNESTQPLSVILASAMDGYPTPEKGRVAEFSSKQDALRETNAIRLVSAQGVHTLMHWITNGESVNEPGNGTSFATPNMAAMLAQGMEAREKAGLPRLNGISWNPIILRSLGIIPGWEPTQGGDYLIRNRFLQEAEKK